MCSQCYAAQHSYRTIYFWNLRNVSKRLVIHSLHRYFHTLHIHSPNGTAPHRYRRPLLSRYEIYIPKAMKTGSANINFLCDILQLPMLFTVLFTADVGFVFLFFLFLLALWLGICVEVDVDIATTTRPNAPALCFCAYPQFSL